MIREYVSSSCALRALILITPDDDVYPVEYLTKIIVLTCEFLVFGRLSLSAKKSKKLRQSSYADCGPTEMPNYQTAQHVLMMM